MNNAPQFSMKICNGISSIRSEAEPSPYVVQYISGIPSIYRKTQIKSARIKTINKCLKEVFVFRISFILCFELKYFAVTYNFKNCATNF